MKNQEYIKKFKELNEKEREIREEVNIEALNTFYQEKNKLNLQYIKDLNNGELGESPDIYVNLNNGFELPPYTEIKVGLDNGTEFTIIPKKIMEEAIKESEKAAEDVRNTFSELMNDNLEIHYDMYGEMEDIGYYDEELEDFIEEQDFNVHYNTKEGYLLDMNELSMTERKNYLNDLMEMAEEEDFINDSLKADIQKEHYALFLENCEIIQKLKEEKSVIMNMLEKAGEPNCIYQNVYENNVKIGKEYTEDFKEALYDKIKDMEEAGYKKELTENTTLNVEFSTYSYYDKENDKENKGYRVNMSVPEMGSYYNIAAINSFHIVKDNDLDFLNNWLKDDFLNKYEIPEMPSKEEKESADQYYTELRKIPENEGKNTKIKMAEDIIKRYENALSEQGEQLFEDMDTERADMIKETMGSYKEMVQNLKNEKNREDDIER